MRIKFNISQLAIYFGITSFSLLTNLNESEAKTIELVDGNGQRVTAGIIVPQSELPNLGLGVGKSPILEGGKLRHPDNRSYEIKYSPPNDVFNFDPLLMFMGAGQGDPARINKQTGKFQLKINGVWRCVSDNQPVSCNSKSALRQKDFKKPLTAQQIREKLVRTGASKTSNEQILAHIKELGGMEKFLDVTSLELSQKLSKQKATIQDELASRGELHPDVVKRGNLKERYAWFELPKNISDEQRAILVYRLLYGDMSNQKVMLIAHGWNDSMNNPDFQQLANIALNRDPSILPLLINWEEGSWNGQGGDSFANALEGKHLRAAKTIMPIARVLYKQSQALGIDFNKSVAVGHSLGSLMVGALGSDQKFQILVALDQPSSFYLRDIRKESDKEKRLENRMSVWDYDIDGNTEGTNFPFKFRDSANFSYSLVGFRSSAGNQRLNTSHQNFLVNFRGGFVEGEDNNISNVRNNPGYGKEHFYVVQTFNEIVSNQRFANGELDIFGANFQVHLETKQFHSVLNLKKTHDGVIFASPNYFDGKNGKVPSVDFLIYKEDGKINLIGMSNSEAIAKQFDTPNLFYFDHSIFKMTPDITGMKIIGGEGKQANCGSKNNYQDVAASNKSDIIDMSKSNEAVLCASQGHAVRQSNKQQDIMIGSSSGKNFFILGDSKYGYYDKKGNNDFVTIRNFENSESKLVINKNTNLQSNIEGKKVVVTTKATRTGGLWGMVTWLIGDGSDKVAVIEFNSKNEANQFDLNTSLEII